MHPKHRKQVLCTFITIKGTPRYRASLFFEWPKAFFVAEMVRRKDNTIQQTMYAQIFNCHNLYAQGKSIKNFFYCIEIWDSVRTIPIKCHFVHTVIKPNFFFYYPEKWGTECDVLAGACPENGRGVFVGEMEGRSFFNAKQGMMHELSAHDDVCTNKGL